MSEIRAAFVALVQLGQLSFAEACRRYGISRKTGYKWLARARATPAQQLVDRSRRPQRCPRQTPAAVEARILEVRAQFGWGPRKIHAFLRPSVPELPSVRTVAAILRRHGCSQPPAAPATPWQRFERSAANELWQLDFKGPLEFARVPYQLFSVLDDHSRYLLVSRLGPDKTMARAWEVLWELFGAVGLPQAILCDNAFKAVGSGGPSPGLSWFDARLVRLGIHPSHGRSYHPQTQGKIERWHGTLQREVWPRVRWDSPEHFQEDLEAWRTGVYNTVRPHEAVADQPPVSRWQPSPRPRPATLPPVSYPDGAVLRKVMQKGEISYRNSEVLVGAGLVGEWVQVEEADGALVVRYAWKEVRRLRLDQLRRRAIV